MCYENKLILTYDPLDDENTISTTDLTTLSTNCKLRKINEKTYILRDKFYVQQGVQSSIENIALYDNDLYNYTYNNIISINFPEGNEDYSFGGIVTENNIVINNRVTLSNSRIYTYNLTCLSGNQKFTKLDYIFPGSTNGLPVTRTLIFYNDK
jgi:hypothetical protein